MAVSYLHCSPDSVGSCYYVKDASTTNPATDDIDLGGDQGNVPMPGSAKIQPFEFKVLEVCLEHTCKCMESEVHWSTYIGRLRLLNT